MTEQLHHVYALYFEVSDVPPQSKNALYRALNTIANTGDIYKVDPDTTEIVTYVGESFRLEEREKEHRSEPFNKNHKTYSYASREMIRCLSKYNVPLRMKILASFPKGETVEEFENFHFCIYANQNHPLSNTATTLDSPSIQRLSDAQSIEEYRAIKQQLERERTAGKKDRIDHSAVRQAIQDSEIDEDALEAIERLSQHFKILSDSATNKTEISAYRYGHKHTQALVLRDLSCPVSYRDYIGKRQITRLLADALVDKLELPPKFSQSTDFNSLTEAEQDEYIDWLSAQETVTPAQQLKNLTRIT